MGVVIRQASLSAVSSYVGAIIGFINVSLLMNNFFSLEEFGLRSSLLDIAVIASVTAQLGTGKSLVKFNPFFSKDKKNDDNGLFSFSLTIAFFGFCIISIILILLRGTVIEHFRDNSSLIADYYWAIFPLIFLMLANFMFESKLQSISNTAFASFTKEVLSKLLITLSLGLFYFQIIDYFQFIVFFLITYALNSLLYIGFLIRMKMFSLKINWHFFKRKLQKIYFRYSFFSIFTNMSGVLLNKLDVLMILFLMGLGSTAIYANAMYLSALMTIPAYAVAKISFPLLSQHYKLKQMDKILELYEKASINQFLIGGILFVLLWSNLDNIFSMQQPEYKLGKYVILILCLSRLFSMLTGVNAQIISVSKYYPFEGISSTILTVVAIGTNFYFIPIYGLNGAAIATAISIVLFNISRTYFIYVKLNLLPFTKNTLKSFVILLVCFLIGTYIPSLDNIFLDIFFRSSILICTLVFLVIRLKVSNDISVLYLKYFGRFINK